MRAGWKTRIDERRYFEEKRKSATEKAHKAAILSAQIDARQHEQKYREQLQQLQGPRYQGLNYELVGTLR